MDESPNPGGDEIPAFATLAADPEIAALLDFEPVPRKAGAKGAWTPELQREFIALLALLGSPGKACAAMGKDRTGIPKLYNSPLGASFRAAWDGAVALAERRGPVLAFVRPGTTPPSVDGRFKTHPDPSSAHLSPGQAARFGPSGGEGEVLNEYGEWEDEDALQRRAAAARGSIANKLLLARRLYLQAISGSPGRRAAFEILTELPVDWDRAARLEPQPDEPWRHPNLRAPDMLLTAEAGWLGDVAHGPDKKAELRRMIDQFRAEQGQPPIQWGEDD